MKHRLFVALVATFVVFSVAFALTTRIVYAAYPNGEAGAVRNESGVNPNDPYDSACYMGATKVASGQIKEDGNTLATVENWYSPHCVKNWALIWWNSGSNLRTFVKIYIPDATGEVAQCYPTVCPDKLKDYYAGGLSPSWTDMVDGHNVTCAYGSVAKTESGPSYHNNDLICDNKK